MEDDPVNKALTKDVSSATGLVVVAAEMVAEEEVNEVKTRVRHLDEKPRCKGGSVTAVRNREKAPRDVDK